MTDEFDVIVIGAGPPGQVAAGRCADGGLAVALVERELVGGECSYWACVPSKTLIRPGDVLAAARRVPGAAEAVTGQLDTAAAFAQRDYMTSSWNDQGALAWVEDEGIELVRGTGRLTGERAVEVELPGGGRRALTARRAVVLATGSSPQIPPVPGLAEARPWDNRGATAATHVPGRLVVLGGGPVGCELAQAFRRLGSREVTVVVRGGRLLAREEPFAGEEVKAAFEAEGIVVRTRTDVAAVRRDHPGGPVTVTLGGGSGPDRRRPAGRRPGAGRRRAAGRDRPPAPHRATSAWSSSAWSPAPRPGSTAACGSRGSGAAGCSRSGTATASPPSPTWASTRAAWPAT